MPAKTAGTHKLTITISSAGMEELQRQGGGTPGEVAASLLESALRRARSRRERGPAAPPAAPLDSWLPEGADPFDRGRAGEAEREDDNPLNFRTIDRRMAGAGRRPGRLIRT